MGNLFAASYMRRLEKNELFNIARRLSKLPLSFLWLRVFGLLPRSFVLQILRLLLMVRSVASTEI